MGETNGRDKGEKRKVRLAKEINKQIHKQTEINLRNNLVPTAQAGGSQVTQPWNRFCFPLAHNGKPHGPRDKNNSRIPDFICFLGPQE